MSQKEKLLILFKMNRNTLTLQQILDAKISSKYTNRISELRALGYRIKCIEHKEAPLKNLYVLDGPTDQHFRRHFDSGGQGYLPFR